MSDYRECVLCHANGPLEKHHAIYRSQGGGNEQSNLILLCKVCHDAVHGIKAYVNNHSCKTCIVRRKVGCYFGEKVLDLPIVTPAPFGRHASSDS